VPRRNESIASEPTRLREQLSEGNHIRVGLGHAATADKNKKKIVRPERTARRQWSSDERPVTPCLSDIDSPARWQQTICLGGAAGGVIYRRRPTQRAAAAQWPPACPGRNSSSRLSTIAHSVRPAL